MTRGLRFLPPLAALLLAAPTPARAASDADPAAGVPADVRVEDFRILGLRRVDTDVVTRVLKSKKGEAFDVAKVTDDIRAVFATNLFRDVVVKRVNGAKRRSDVILVYEVREKPSIKNVKFVGNDEIGNDDVKGAIDVKVGQILNVDALAKNVGKIRELYINKGYYLAEIEYKFTESGENEVEVEFIIKENDKVEVKKITFLGNKNVTDDELKSQMGTKEGNLISFLTGAGTYREELFQADLYRLTNVYFDRGYINARALKPQVQISGDRRHIYITIPVEEGEKYAFGKIEFGGDIELKDDAGNVLVSADQVRERLTIKEGAVFNRTQLFQDITRAAELYRDRGYAFANVTPNNKINPDKRIVDMSMDVERGDKVYFETIEVVGNTKTRDKVIRRELRIYEGELFSSSAIEYSKQRITALGYFETVEITTERGSAPDRMKVKVEIKEKATGTFQVGAGFSSLERFIATAQVSQQNFLGRGQSMSLQAQLSFGPYGRQIFSFNFVEPYFLDSMFTATGNLYWTQQLFANFQRSRRGGSVGVGYPLNDNGTLRLFLNYTLEYILVSQTTIYGTQYSRALYNLNQQGFISNVRADLQYDSRDNRLFPTRGNFDLVSIEVADKYIGSQFDFIRLSGTFRYYYPILPGVIFRTNLQLGWIWSRDPQGPPISERYFLGGVYSLRGFAPLAVGPSLNVPTITADPTSGNSPFVIGGNKQLQLNIEIEFPIFEKAGFRGVVFLDTGNAYDESQNFFYVGQPQRTIPDVYPLGGGTKSFKPPLGLVWAAGLGIRWFSPIGPLRFEWGIPFTKIRPYDRDVVFQFTIGNFF